MKGGWQSAGPPQAASPPDYYVLFRVADWDVSRNWWARVSFQDSDGRKSYYDTFIRRDPADKPVLTVAGFTGMGVMGRTAYAWAAPPKEGEVLVGRWTPANVWMPFADAVSAVQKQGVDLLFFTGDQVYESKPSPKTWQRRPTDDYLYKWLL